MQTKPPFFRAALRRLWAVGALALLWVWVAPRANAQTVVVTELDTFSTTGQNMWGPNGNPFTINRIDTLFFQSWNQSGGGGGISYFAGFPFGASANAGTWGHIGAVFSIQDFTTGDLGVDYPFQAQFTIPDSNTYDPGDWVTVESDYLVQPSAEINTNYPNAGTVKLDMLMRLGMYVNLQVCIFSCLNIPLIPNFDTGNQTFTIFKVDQNGAEFLGPVYPFTNDLCTQGFPPCIPGEVHVPFFPAEVPDNPFGISGEFTLPDVQTGPTVIQPGQCLYTEGSQTYATISLEVFKFISNFLPPQIGEVLGNLSGTMGLPAPFGSIYGATITWNLMSASFSVSNTNNQEFSFCPTLESTLQFPTQVNWEVQNTSGTVVNSGFGTSVLVEFGQDVRFQWPCNWQFMDITPSYAIQNEDNFSNHTYDQISVDFLFEALQFSIDLPQTTIIPGFTIPQFCFTYYYPCPTWSNPFRWCDGYTCTPAITVPPVIAPGFSFGIGPLVSLPANIFTTPPITWFQDTWSLGGFTTRPGNSFRMKPRPFNVALATTDVLCKGDSTATLTATVTNGSAPYTYEWYNTTQVVSASTTDVLNNAPAGPVFVQVTDVNGCERMATGLVSEPSTQVEITNLVVTDVDCFGNATGAIDITVAGGVPGYGYTWSNGANAEDLTAIVQGTYDVLVADANGCTARDTGIVTEPTQLVATHTFTDVNCFGGNDGTAQVAVSGGTLAYTYSWAHGPTSENLNNLTAGAYSYTVTDGKGCTATGNFVVAEPAAPLNLTSIIQDVTCFGLSDGAIDVSPTGGTPPYAFAWTNSQLQILAATTEDLTNLPAATYLLVATDSRNCVDSLYSVVTEPNKLVLADSVIGVSCFGGTDGAVYLTVQGGTLPYTFGWSNGAGTQDIINVTAGPYNVLVTDGNNCTEALQTAVQQPALPLVGVISPTHIRCFGDATGAAQLEVTGGTPPYTFQWSNGDVSQNLTNLLAGTFSVQVTDAKGCTWNGTVTLNEPAAPLAIASVLTNVSCFGQQNGGIDLTTTGGTAPYSYQWTNSATVILAPTTEDLPNRSADVYTVRVTDAQGCWLEDTFSITEPSAFAATGIVTQVLCFGMPTGAIDYTVSGGTVPYTYAWSNAAASEDLTDLTAGVYTLTLTDANGCTRTDNFTVTEPNAALAVASQPRAVGCFGENTGSVLLEVLGGTSPYTYAWSNGSTSPNLPNVTAGTYTVTVTDANGCTALSGAVVPEPAAALGLAEVIDSATCFGYADGRITLNITGGTVPYRYQWANSTVLITENAEVISGLAAGTYQMIVQDANNCEVRGTYVVPQPQAVTLTLMPTPAACFGAASGAVDLTVVGGTAPYTYLWTNSATTEDLTNVGAGYYEVAATDDNGCVYREHTLVGQAPELVIESNLVPVSCKDEADGRIDLIVEGGTPPYRYIWNNGSVEEDLADLLPGTYSVTVLDANDCQADRTFTLADNPSLCVDIPSSFTPNGDGINDTWVIRKLALYGTASTSIFNQWGQRVFFLEGAYVPWDGTFRGQELPAATYYYVIELGNGDAPFTGPVTIVR